MKRRIERKGRFRGPWALALAGCLLVAACAATEPPPRAVDGRIDLARWDFEARGDVPLVGRWQICWGRLLGPEEDCVAGWQAVPVRGLWHEPGVGSPFGGRGVATYRLRLRLPPGPGPLAIVAGGPISAHRLFIEGVERGGVGEVGQTADTTRARVHNRFYELPAGRDRVELRVEVANFEFRGGGLRRLWYVGESDSLQRRMGRAVLREGTLFLTGVVVGLGFLALYALRPAERARGWFGLMALVLGLRAVPASISGFGELVAPWLSWAWIVRLEYLGMGLAYVAAVGYVREKIPDITPPRTLDTLQVAGLAFSVIVLLAPMPLVLETLPVQWALPTILILLVVVCYGRAWRRGVSGAGITALTALAYAGVVVHDIVRSAQSGVGASVELFPYAVVLWILAEAYQLLQGFHQSFEQVESLSDELGEANFELQETEAAIVRFVPFDFLRALGKASIRDIESGDHATSQMSVLHCGFHALPGGVREPGAGHVADEAASDAAFERMAALVARLEPGIHHHGGFVDACGGDGFQAYFPGGAADAVAAARAIVERLESEDSGTRDRPSLPADVRIGIDTGPLQLGTIGSGEHLVRSVLGRPVDEARRIEGLARRSGSRVLISDATREALAKAEGEPVAMRPMPVPGAEESAGAAGAEGNARESVYALSFERAR